jgi:alpha-N-arabinofuranosidase
MSGFHCALIDLKTGKFLRPAAPLWGGTGGSAPEAPHLYKINGWYYQMIAEGGTELGHMETIARCKELYGTYEPCPHNPILTHKHRKGDLIQATGHADLIEDNDGNWWAVFLGYRQTHQYFHHLGRETFLAPVTWRDGWPIINNGEPIRPVMETPGKAIQQLNSVYETDFAAGIEPVWVHLRNPMDGSCRAEERGIILKGNEHTLSGTANPAFLGFRQRDLSNQAEVDISFLPGRNYEEAGISVYYKNDAHIDICITKKGNTNCLLFRKVVGEINHEAACLPVCGGKVTIRIIADKLEYKFYMVINGTAVYLGRALTRYVSTEAHELGFTGVFYALYATGNGVDCRAEALFTRFSYQGFDREDADKLS